MKHHLHLLLLAASSLAFASAAQAQDAPAADTAVEVAEEKPDAAAEMEFLKAQVEALQAQVEALSARTAKAEPSWKGAPQWAGDGFTFKVRGRFMYDTAFIDSPFAVKPNKNLGFNSRVRRVRLGAEGTLQGDFGYKFEMDFANSTVGFGDAILTYSPKGKPWSVTIGNHETMDGLEQITSSRFTSFIERNQGNDAFINTRRLGLSFGLVDSSNVWRFNAGAFTAHTIDASLDNDGYILAARATYSPQAMGGQLHFGANYQYRHFQSNNGANASVSANAPSTNQTARYRARPFLQTTGERFVDTGNLAAEGDQIFGVEAAGVFGPLHVAGELMYTKVNAYGPGDFKPGLDAFTGTSIVYPNGDPSFISYYAEVGYFLTGETRGYKNGLWDRTKVLNPFDKGGWGALQVNARYDYLDLDSSKLKNGRLYTIATGVTTPSTNLSRGGKQTGYQLGLTWIPQDYVRFIVQYVRTEVKGGPFAAAAKPTSTKAVDQRTYGVDSVAVRAQFDF